MSRSALLACAAGLPLFLYVASAGGAGYWLDSGEFVAATTMLDIAHPPGHPLSLLWGKLWTLLPLGSLSFRVAIGQAVAAGAAAGFLFVAIRRSVAGFPGVPESSAGAIALSGTWLPMLAYPTWFQAVRPEVYALHGALLLAAVCLLCRLVAPGRDDPRPLYAACLCVGLALANHHFTAFMFFPTLLFAAALVAMRRGVRPIATCAGFGLMGLGVYAYLPARALALPPMNLGDPRTLERIYWVVSAQVYTKEMGTENAQPMAERVGDVLITLVESLHGPFLVVAVVGGYFALRFPTARQFGILWLLTALVAFYFRAWVGPVRGNPDALGYLFAAFAAVGALMSLALGAAYSIAAPKTPGAVRTWALGAAAFALLIAAVQVRGAWAQVDLSGYQPMEEFDDARIRDVPPRSVVIASSPSTVFRYWQDAATSRVRPDIALLPLPFLAYPGVAGSLSRAQPALAPLVDDYLGHGSLREGPLLHAAAQRPVLVELDLKLPPQVYPVLVPMGLLHRVAPRPLAKRLTLELQGPHLRALDALHTRLGGGRPDVETSRQLLWIHYTHALYFADRDLKAAALDHARRARALQPHDRHIRRLFQALDAWQLGTRFDVAPHLILD